MMTQLHGKYERKCESILYDLENELDIQNTNLDLKTLAEPAENSILNQLIEKLKETAFELDIDYETPFELTDSQIMALNLFFKL